MPEATPSKTGINRAGELVRRARFEPSTLTDKEWNDLDDAIRVIRWFRAEHAYPMAKVRYGLRSMVQTEGCREAIGQRLKRIPRIVGKLQRTVGSPTGRTSLARLEDVGGVRAVLQDGAELERVRTRIERNWGDKFKRPPRDYIRYPKDLGYRAVHFVVERDGRAIEIQLRTKGQQQWADAVESLDARLGTTVVNLKDGQGPPEILEYFSAAGELIFLREYGRTLTPELIERFAAARRAVVEKGYYRA